jgi:hypothetical protein
MSGFGEREKDFENKYAYEEKIGFKIEARTAKLLGLWAAEKMGLPADGAQAYAMEVVSAKLESSGFDGIQRKVASDLSKKGIEMTDHFIKGQTDKLYEEARNQILQESA